jgi:hypothetical protein
MNHVTYPNAIFQTRAAALRTVEIEAAATHRPIRAEIKARDVAFLLHKAVHLTDTNRAGWDGLPETLSLSDLKFKTRSCEASSVTAWSQHPDRKTDTEHAYCARVAPLRHDWRTSGRAPGIQNVVNAHEVHELVRRAFRGLRPTKTGGWPRLDRARARTPAASFELYDDLLYALPNEARVEVRTALRMDEHPTPLHPLLDDRTALGLTALAEARLKLQRLDVPKHLEKHRKALARELDALLKDAPPEVRFADLA